MSNPLEMNVLILRSSPSENSAPRYEAFNVSGTENMRVLDVIRSIYENQAGDLAYQFACRIGRCGTCAVRVNGVPVLACQERCKESMRIEPLSPFPVLRDLVVDRTEIEARYSALELTPSSEAAGYGVTAIAPHAAGESSEAGTEAVGAIGPNSAKESWKTHAVRPIDPHAAEELCKLDSCMACMVCVSGCPAVEERSFDGPAFMLKLRYMDQHPADNGNRLQQAIDGGMLECFACDACTQLCPADLSPAQAIRGFRKDMILGKASVS